MYIFNSFIDKIFAACCGIMYGMADMFGRTYEYVNVVLFCYVDVRPNKSAMPYIVPQHAAKIVSMISLMFMILLI